MPPSDAGGPAPDLATGPGDRAVPRRSGSTRALPVALLAIAVVLLLVRVLTGIFERVEREPRADRVTWRAPGDAAVAEARSTGKPLLYDFSAEWCGPCRIMQNEVFGDPRWAAKINSVYVPVRVVDRQREEGRNPPVVDALQRRYRVEAFPTLVVESPDGVRHRVLQGYAGSLRTTQWISTASREVLGTSGAGAPTR